MISLTHRFAAYVWTFGLVLLTMIGIAAGFCAFVDPYGILGTPTIPRWTEDKLAAAHWPRHSKPYRIGMMRPAILLIGSSSINVGIDPDSVPWPEPLRPAYNLGIDGAPLETQRHFLLHALAVTRPRLVVIGTSFEDILLAPAAPLKQDADTYAFAPRMRVLADGRPNPAYPWARLKDIAFATLSFDAIADSVTTLLRQRDPDRDRQTRAGFDTRRRFAVWTAAEGAEAVIRAAMRMKLRDIAAWSAAPAQRMQALADMIRSARGAGADVVVMVQPTYVAGLELRRQTGLSGAAQTWLHDLVALTEATASETGGPGHVAIWDFSAYSRYTAEPLPKPGDTARPLRWFWDTIHFRPELGALMMERMLGIGGPADLGEPLTLATIGAVNERGRQAETEWVAAHPESVARIAAMLAEQRDVMCRRNAGACTLAGGGAPSLALDDNRRNPAPP
jgi:hypothetical protein